MTIRHLEIFVEVCRQGNMSRAARELMISQSSVSQTVTRLEEEYGVRLFLREGHALCLTGPGRRLQALAEQVLESVHRLEQGMQEEQQPRRLRIGCSTTVGNALLHPLLERYRERFPGTELTVEIGGSRPMEGRLLAGELDLAIVQKGAPAPGLCCQDLMEEVLLLVCRPDHPWAGTRRTLAELSSRRFVTREPGSGTDRLLRQAFEARGLSLQVSWVCSSADAVKRSVLQGEGLAILSRLLVEQELREGTLDVITPLDWEFRRRFALVWRRDEPETPELRRFRALCREQTGENR